MNCRKATVPCTGTFVNTLAQPVTMVGELIRLRKVAVLSVGASVALGTHKVYHEGSRTACSQTALPRQP